MLSKEERKEISKKVLVATQAELCQIIHEAFERGRITEAEFYIAIASIQYL